MNVQVLQHAPFEGLAGLAPLLEDKGAIVHTTPFYDGAQLPPLGSLDLVIAMGGPMSVNDEAEFPWLRDEKQFLRDAIKRGVPVLGVCLGAQLIANALDARVYRNAQKEIGWFPIEAVDGPGDVFRFPETLEVFHWHGETFDLPAGAVHLAQSEACKHQAFQVGRRTLALQFHIEVTPRAVADFVDNCGNDLSPAPFVQSRDKILAKPEFTYDAANAWMSQTLDYLLD